MSDFKAKMHQIRFQLGLRPRPHWGSLQRSPRSPSCDDLLLRGKGRGKGRGGARGKGRGGRGGERRGQGRNVFPHLFNSTLTTAYWLWYK